MALTIRISDFDIEQHFLQGVSTPRTAFPVGKIPNNEIFPIFGPSNVGIVVIVADVRQFPNQELVYLEHSIPSERHDRDSPNARH